jgi:hypothetical protein
MNSPVLAFKMMSLLDATSRFVHNKIGQLLTIGAAVYESVVQTFFERLILHVYLACSGNNLFIRLCLKLG